MRPEDATHRDSGGNLYKAGEELNWLRWGNDAWFIYGTVSAGELRPLKGRPSAIRPDGATHSDNVGNYYKSADELNWLQYDHGHGWFNCGTLPHGTLYCLPSMLVLENDAWKWDHPGVSMAPCMPEPSLAPAPTLPVGWHDCRIAKPILPMGTAVDLMLADGQTVWNISLTAKDWGTAVAYRVVNKATPAPAPAPCPFLPEGYAAPGAPFTNYFTKYQFVGSRVTCNPPPLDTDQDVLVLVHQSNHAVMERKMLEEFGFVKEGSLPAEADTRAGKDNVFHSYRKGDMNYIVTTDEAFYRRFSTATELARKYNLMEKSDRIQLFQAVLYGKWWA